MFSVVFVLQRQGSGAAASNKKTSGGQGKQTIWKCVYYNFMSSSQSQTIRGQIDWREEMFTVPEMSFKRSPHMIDSNNIWRTSSVLRALPLSCLISVWHHVVVYITQRAFRLVPLLLFLYFICFLSRCHVRYPRAWTAWALQIVPFLWARPPLAMGHDSVLYTVFAWQQICCLECHRVYVLYCRGPKFSSPNQCFTHSHLALMSCLGFVN